DETNGFVAGIFSTHPPVRSRIAVLTDMAHLSLEDLEHKLKDFRRVSPIMSQRVGAIEGFSPAGWAADPIRSQSDINVKNACPKCCKILVSKNYEGVPLSICIDCGGTFVDQDRLTRILYRQDSVYSPELLRLCQLILEDLKASHVLNKIDPRCAWVIDCPACGSKMHHEFYAFSYAVEIDRCLSCKKVWFGKNELEILQYLFEHNKELFQVGEFFAKT
ncbi:MAG: zf-TFIIB domain-containing protein, partial [Candidatus Omnitrophica bacterium]|nr:zf-TFIIB domain-containing protein [Candidatus Omnitrophota bacterium]